MVNVVRVGASVLRYRGGEGQWAWAIHRVAGLGVLAFLMLHIFDIFLAAFGPELFNELLFLYKGPVARFLEVLLAFGLLYHALNGLRIIGTDFIPALASLRIAKVLFYIQLVVFLLIFIPAGYFMMISLPDEPFANNAVIAGVVVFGLLALPAVIAAAANLVPAATTTRLDSDLTSGNYRDAMERILRGRQRRPLNRTELNIWLFMRISGFLLIVLALLHFYITHFIINVETMSFNTLIDRWQDPATGWFWRTYDLALLGFAFTHGMLGARYVINDYVHSRGWRVLLLGGALLTWIALMFMGAYIIFTFKALPA